MPRVLISSRNFNAESDGVFPAVGFTNLNGFNGELRVINPTGTSGVISNPYGNHADARDNGTFNANQYAKIVITGHSPGNNANAIGVCLRLGTGAEGGAGVSGYRIRFIDGVVYVVSVAAGVETAKANAAVSWTNGDSLSAEISGSLLTAFQNDIAIGALTGITATEHATGNPGITGILGGAGTLRGDNYEAGNVTAGSSAPLRRASMSGGMSGMGSPGKGFQNPFARVAQYALRRGIFVPLAFNLTGA